jgi:hypothetical protein
VTNIKFVGQGFWKKYAQLLGIEPGSFGSELISLNRADKAQFAQAFRQGIVQAKLLKLAHWKK